MRIANFGSLVYNNAYSSFEKIQKLIKNKYSWCNPYNPPNSNPNSIMPLEKNPKKVIKWIKEQDVSRL